MGPTTDTSALIYTDADNTLWDTNAVFADAQLRLLQSAESIAGLRVADDDPLRYVRQYDQAIAKLHHARLRYPPAFLIRALVLGLNGLAPGDAASRVISEGATPSEREARGINDFEADIAKVPPLLPGVRVGLEQAYESGVPVYVVTEGPAERARDRLKFLHIERYASGLLSAVKSRELYARLADKAAQRRPVMIGDQPDRDVRLAHDAGLTTVLVVGTFRPEWTLDKDIAVADTVAPNFAAAIAWILERYAGQTRQSSYLTDTSKAV
jgi:putative hydrolase of the HAD superfamily